LSLPSLKAQMRSTLKPASCTNRSVSSTTFHFSFFLFASCSLCASTACACSVMHYKLHAHQAAVGGHDML
jgi:hypothetical protein